MPVIIFRLNYLVYFYCSVVCTGLKAFHAVITQLIRIQITSGAFAALNAILAIVQQTLLYIHVALPPKSYIYYTLTY